MKKNHLNKKKIKFEKKWKIQKNANLPNQINNISFA